MSAVPQLRNLLKTRIKRDFIIAFSIAAVATVTVKLTYNNKRISNYKNFYDNYDMKADYKRMVEAGVFQSVAPDGSVTGEGW